MVIETKEVADYIVICLLLLTIYSLSLVIQILHQTAYCFSISSFDDREVI